MKYILLTKNSKAIVSDEDFNNLNQFKWQLSTLGYAVRNVYIGKVNGKWKRKTIWMHRVINSTPPDLQTDHINGDKLDNRRENLRDATRSQNMANVRKNRGIDWRGNRWRVRVGGDYIGRYRELEEAIIARNSAASARYGEYANEYIK